MVKEKKKLNNAEIKKILKPYNEDIKRHMGALEEHFLDGVKGIGELCTHLNEKIDGIKTTQDSHTEMIGNLAVDMETVKGDVKNMKGDIKTMKVDIKTTKDDLSMVKKDVTGLKQDVGVLKQDVGVLKQDMKVAKEDVVVLKDDMVVVKSDLQIIKTDVEPRVAHLEAGTASGH